MLRKIIGHFKKPWNLEYGKSRGGETMAARITFKRMSDDYLADLAARKYSGIEPKSAVKLLRGMGYGDNDMMLWRTRKLPSMICEGTASAMR